ncbi:MAG: transporter [Hyphobacterium sp.]|nr:MAG: transporter [Hyphobacterium sp.]
MSIPPVATLLMSVLIGALGQIFFKWGVRPEISGEVSSMQVYFRPATLLGFSCYGLSALLYIWSLRHIPLSIAYPSLALSYVIVVAASALLFSEAMTLQKALAIALIVTGVAVLWK